MECSRTFLFWHSVQLVWDLAYHWGFFYSSFSFSVFLGWRYPYLLIYVKSYLVFLVTHCGETEFTNLVFMNPCIIYNSYRNSQRDVTVYQNFSLFRVYIRLNVFRATHRPSSGAQNCTSSLWFCIRERLLDAESVQQPQRPQPFTYAKPETASTVLSSWWWAVCRPKHVELHIIMK